ncbi:hypothetical protein CEP53_008868 [Fusarium sp. AF-6]|nr:hypothetical protein CEP53_008868 [Fusarium sp. AF-6]
MRAHTISNLESFKFCVLKRKRGRQGDTHHKTIFIIGYPDFNYNKEHISNTSWHHIPMLTQWPFFKPFGHLQPAGVEDS